MQNGKIKVLVVDDTKHARELLAEALDEAGYEVEEVGSGEAAIECIRKAEGDFDFIIMDQVLLGGMDGIEATRIIKQDYSQIRTIVMTIYGDGESSQASLDAGADRYVFRPLDLEEAVHDIMALIEAARELSQIEESPLEAFWMSSTFKGMNMAMSIVDRTYRVLYANDLQNQVAGGELRKGGICWVEFHQAYQQKEPCSWCPVKPLFEGEDPVVKTVPLFKRDRWQYWQTGASAILDSGGQVIAALKWGVEVTEREQAHVAALTARSLDERLEAALEQIRILGYSRARLYELSEDETTLLGRKQVGGTNVPITEIRFRVEEDPYSQIALSSWVPVIHRIGEHGDTLFDPELDRDGLKEWLDVPLWASDGQLMGKISIDNKIIGPVRPDKLSIPRTITDEHFESLLTIARFAANTIQDAHKHERAVREAGLQRQLREIGADIAQGLSVKEVLDRIAQACLDLSGASSINIRLREDDKLIKVAGKGRYSEIMREDISMEHDALLPCVQAMRERKPYIAKDARQDKYIRHWKGRTKSTETRQILDTMGSFAAFPLEFENEIIGVLVLLSEEKDAFTQEACTAINDLRPHAAIAVENARLYERTRKQAQQRAALFEVGKAISSSLNLEEVLEKIFELTGRLIPFETALLFLPDRETGELSVRESYGYDKAFIEEQGFTFRPGEGYTGWIAKTQQPLLIENVELCTDIQPKYRFIGKKKPLKSFIGVPLIARGQLNGVLDVTSSKRQAFSQEHLDSLLSMADQLATAIERARLAKDREEMFSDIAHQLKTPLTSMKIPVELLADGKVKDPDTVQEYYRIIASATEEFNRMVDDILNLNRIEAGAFDLWKRETSVTDMIERVVRLFRFSAVKKAIEIQTVLDHNVDYIQVDPDKMKSALQTLLENAINFSEKGTKVTIFTFDDQEALYISVQDEGYGIPEDELPHIFEKHFRGRIATEKAIDGVGIGLTIAEHVVALHGGSISVEGKLGEGTKFTIRLPP